MVDKSEKIIKLLKKEKTQKILSYWDNKPDKWIQSNELRSFFVEGHNNKNTIFKKTLYKHDSELYRSLGKLTEIGILKKDKKKNENGKINSFYKPKKKFVKDRINEGLRLQNKTALDFFPSDKIIDFDIKRKNRNNKEYTVRKIILYGLSKDMLKKMPEEKKEMVEKKKIANIEITDESTEEFGKVAKVILPNKSAIYVFKDGWCLKHPEYDKSMTIPWDEINLAIELTKKLGYINSSNKSKTVKEK